jgi:hypothetical protein
MRASAIESGDGNGYRSPICAPGIWCVAVAGGTGLPSTSHIAMIAIGAKISVDQRGDQMVDETWIAIVADGIARRKTDLRLGHFIPNRK